MHKLYFAPGACSFVPHVALEVIQAATGEAFETQIVRLHKGEQKSPDYLALNPDGVVPTLIAEGRPLTQIVAICEYLDRKYPTLGLLPAGAAQRTEAFSLLGWINSTAHPAFTHVFMPFKFADDEAARAEIKRFGLNVYRGYLERMQTRVAQARPFLFGDRLSLVDVYALVLFRWGGLGGIDPDHLPVYQAYVGRVAAEAPVATALAREGTPLNMFKKPA